MFLPLWNRSDITKAPTDALHDRYNELVNITIDLMVADHITTVSGDDTSDSFTKAGHHGHITMEDIIYNDAKVSNIIIERMNSEKLASVNAQRFKSGQKPRKAVLEVFNKKPRINKEENISRIEKDFCDIFISKLSAKPFDFVPAGAVDYYYMQKEGKSDPNQVGTISGGIPRDVVKMYSGLTISCWQALQLCKETNKDGEKILETTLEGLRFLQDKRPPLPSFYLALRDAAKHTNATIFSIIGFAASIIGIYQAIVGFLF